MSVVGLDGDPFAVGERAEHVASMRLVGSEYRTRRVPVGHLELPLDGDAGAQERLFLDVAHANCAALVIKRAAWGPDSATAAARQRMPVPVPETTRRNARRATPRAPPRSLDTRPKRAAEFDV